MVWSREIDASAVWIKVVGMLQQNWAFIHETRESFTEVLFFDDASRIFDKVVCRDTATAINDLKRNGFFKYVDDPSYAEFIALPCSPIVMERMHRRPTYSSGEYWR